MKATIAVCSRPPPVLPVVVIKASASSEKTPPRGRRDLLVLRCEEEAISFNISVSEDNTK